MIYTYKKVEKQIEQTEGTGAISALVSTVQAQYKSFDEIFNKDYTNLKKAKVDTDSYYEFKKQKSLEAIKNSYVTLLNKELKETQPKYTQEDKEAEIAIFEANNPAVLDENLALKKDPRLTKKLQRVSIKAEVRDDADSIADLAKWSSLLTSTMFVIYDTLTDTAKGKIAPEQRALIESMQDAFKGTETVADHNIKSQGTSFINDMLKKEAKIKKIVKGE